MTVLTSEFTHFNLVIRLSKAKQLAFLFFGLLGLSRCSCGPREPRHFRFFHCEACPNYQKLRFHCCSSSFRISTWQDRQQACPLPAGMVSSVSGEVKHVVHLIRWNL